jgi:hypothetical protein
VKATPQIKVFGLKSGVLDLDVLEQNFNPFDYQRLLRKVISDLDKLDI